MHLQKKNKTQVKEDELQTLQGVAKRFEKTGTNDIIDISHKEKAWEKISKQENSLSVITTVLT